MKRRLWRRRWRILTGFLLLPPLFWTCVLSIAPTEWARSRIVARLIHSTGRPVRLGALRIGALGGVRLSDLEIGAPDKADDPWLKVARARINISILQLMLGKAEPTAIQAEGLTLRVLRRRDGSLELSDMLQADSSASRTHGRDPADPCPIEAAGVDVSVRDARITLIDEPSGTRLELAGVKGRATWQDHRGALHDLRGTLNGGPFELSATLDQTVAEPAFEGRFNASGVALNRDMDALSYLVPVLSDDAGSPGTIDGTLTAVVYLRGQGITREAVRRTLEGQGQVSIEPIQLDRSQFLSELAEMIDLPSQLGVGSVKTSFQIAKGRITTDDLTLDLARMPIVLTGWTDFDGRLDYHIRADRLAERLPNKARDLLSELSIDLNGLSAVHVRGTVKAMDVTMETPGNGNPDSVSSPGHRRPLRGISRELRDRLFR